MNYDPIKDSVGGFFNRSITLRKLFYRLLDILLLRSWHIHREVKKWETEKPADREILDAGCGFGQYSFWMARRNPDFNILSVDVKEDYLRDCDLFFKKCGVNNVRFQVEDLTVFQKPNTVNLIICVDVMEHILEDVEVFKNFYVDLKEGGMVLISTPSDLGGSDVDHNSGESFIGEHVRDGYNKDEIINKMKSAGFSRADVRYSYGRFGMLAWRLSMKFPITVLNMSKAFFILLPFYYAVVAIPVLILNYLDVSFKNERGAGLIVKAWK